MPFRNRLKRLKNDIKQGLGISSSNASTTSLPNTSQLSPSPLPQTLRRALTPQPDATVPTVHTNPGSHLLAPDAYASHMAAPTTTSVPPSPVLDSQPSVSSPSVPLGSGQTEPPGEGKNLDRARSTGWAGLKTLLKVLDTSADVFPPLKSAIGGLEQCIGIFENASKAHEDYNDLRTTLDSLLEDLGRFFADPTPPTMTTSMKNLSIGLNEELRLVQQKYGRGAVQRHTQALGDVNDIMECYRRIAGHLERITLNSNLTIWKIVDEQATESRLRQLVPKLSAVYNSAESEDVKRGPCTPGTRIDEIARLLDWARSKDGEDVYWMNGMAGTGKTTISYSVCTELAQKMELGASFFCSRLIPECRDVKLIIPAIAYQLARFSRPFRCALLRVLEADPDVHTRVLKTQFESLLVKPLSEAQHTLPLDFVVVIDALDECDNEDGVAQILEVLLKRTHSLRIPVRFLVSSRPEPAIYSRMMKRVGTNTDARLVLHELDADNVNHDIKTYLQAELKDVGLEPSQIAALVENSGVLFIYASTAARYIKQGKEQDVHEERLNKILGLSPASSGGENRDIDALYSTILEAALKSQMLDIEDKIHMKSLLDTVICAQEPMTAVALAGLLKLKSARRVAGLLRALFSVLNLSETSGLVTTLHASFPDFMLDKQRSSSFHCDSTTSHARLAQVSFNLINSNKPQFNICAIESSHGSDKMVADIAQRAGRAIPVELFYACRYWMTHLKLANRFDNADELLHDFLSSRLLLWMEVLNVKQSMHLGPSIIQQAEGWCRDHDLPTDVAELAHDAWCFVTMFTSHAVSQSTPHLYASMLPFWSDAAPISMNYKERMRGAIKIKGIALSRRQTALLATWSFDDDVRSACFSPEGSLIAFGTASSMYVIDATTGRTVLGPLNHKGTVKCVAFSPDGSLISSGSEDNTIRVWNSQNGQLVGDPLKGHEGGVNSVRFLPHGPRIVSSSLDNSVRVWDLQSGRTVVGPLQYSIFDWASLCLSSDGTRIACGNKNDGTVRVWDARSGEILFEGLKGHTNLVLSVCFSPDGTHMVSGSADNTMRVWSSQDGQLIGGPLEGHSSYIRSIAFSPDGNQIASGSSDKTIRLWDLNSNPISARTLEGHTGSVTSVAFSSDGSRIVSCSDDNTIRVWDARTRATVADSLEGHTGPVYSAGFSPDGKHIVSGSGDKTIRMWDAQSGQMVGGPFEGHTDRVRSVCFSPDGTRIASGSDDMTVRVWDVQRGQSVLGPLKGHSWRVSSICVSPDGTLIASGSIDETIKVWDAQNGKPIGNPLRGHGGNVKSVCFSPDSTRIASGSDDQTIRVWDSRSGQTVVEPLKGHTGNILSVCFSPHGTRIASGSSDKTARVWDVQSGQPIFDPLEGHTYAINSVCFSPDGKLIVSGSFDKTIRLWDARSGNAIGDPLIGHTGPVWSVAFSPDGMHIVSGSSDQTIRVWDVCGLLRMSGVTDYLPSPEPAPISPPRSHESWVLREDGWAVDPEGHLLVWVPPDLHLRLIRPCDTSIISTNGSFKLDFSSANLGESWAGCYQTPSC